jgi:hypothetical protein
MKTITLKMRDSPTHKHFGGQRGAVNCCAN